MHFYVRKLHRVVESLHVQVPIKLLSDKHDYAVGLTPCRQVIGMPAFKEQLKNMKKS